MTPSLSIPTDNIYKFACIFGLALMITATVSYVSLFASTLESQNKIVESILLLEKDISPATEKLLELKKSSLMAGYEVHSTAQLMLIAVFAFGLSLSLIGGWQWYIKIQKRDDQIAYLQIQKLKVEIAKLNSESDSSTTAKTGSST